MDQQQPRSSKRRRLDINIFIHSLQLPQSSPRLTPQRATRVGVHIRPQSSLALYIHHLAVAMVSFSVAAGALALFTVWALKTYLKYRRSMDAVGWLPGPRSFFSARALFARLLPNIPYVNRRSDWPWRLKYNCRHSYLSPIYQTLNLVCLLLHGAAFKAYDGDMFAAVTFWPSVGVAVHTADPYVIKVHILRSLRSPSYPIHAASAIANRHPT